jgi:hypothetical protein
MPYTGFGRRVAEKWKNFTEPPRRHDEVTFGRSLESEHRGPGRPTPGDDTLGADRDALVWLLSVGWANVGWELPRAATTEELRQALAPLRGNPYEHYIAQFLRPTSVVATAEEVRATREALQNAVEHQRATQSNHEKCVDAARIAELAMNQAQPNRQQAIQAELLRLWGESKEARRQLASAQATLQAIEEKLKDEEAAFAQKELLDFITRKEYARNPLGLANAMAGLPDIGWGQSRERCAKLACSQWPNFQFEQFETIRAIWNRRHSFPDLSPVQLFRQEIESLPRTVIISVPQPSPHPAKNKKIENAQRSDLAKNWARLRPAIEDSVGARAHPERVPFLILSRFAENASKRTPEDLLLEAKERIDG